MTQNVEAWVSVVIIAAADVMATFLWQNVLVSAGKSRDRCDRRSENENGLLENDFRFSIFRREEFTYQ